MGGPPVDKDSFVQNEMRAYAMKLHTRDQAPREGQQKAEKPFTAWEPKRENYLQFLVDSLVVYETLDNIVARYKPITDTLVHAVTNNLIHFVTFIVMKN